MAQSDFPDDHAPRARGSRFHLEQAAHDRAPSAAPREPPLLPPRDPFVDFVDRPVTRTVAAEASGERARVDQPATPAPPPTRADASPPRDDGPSPGARDGVPGALPRVAPVGAPEPEREVVRRVFDERTGDEWRVFERDARRIPGTRGARCLFFDGEGIVRRVWHYPADWQTLPAAALLALMDRPPLGER